MFPPEPEAEALAQAMLKNGPLAVAGALEAVQRGRKSRGFRGPLWGQQESRIRHYHREIDRYLNGQK